MADVVTLLHLAEEPEQAKAVQYVLSELLRNVREHSQSPYGAVVAAQYYAGKKGPKYVSVGVADTGVGVLTTLQRNYDAASDRAAVELATRPGLTGAEQGIYGASNNAGAGLFCTRRLAQASDAYFALASGDAMFRTSTAVRPPADEDLVSNIAPYPGTIVCANFALEKEVDFDDFLGVTGRAFSQLNRNCATRSRQGFNSAEEIKVEPTSGTRLAENKDAAAILRDEVVLPTLEQGEKVVIDFAAVDVATQSYVHALIAEAIRRQGIMHSNS